MTMSLRPPRDFEELLELEAWPRLTRSAAVSLVGTLQLWSSREKQVRLISGFEHQPPSARYWLITDAYEKGWEALDSYPVA